MARRSHGAAMQIEMIDYSKPPPGYTADGQWWSHPPTEPSKLVFLGGYVDGRNIAKVAPNNGALAAAWAHYKAKNDPPGLRTADGWWCLADEDMLLASADGGVHHGYADQAAARAAAWAWHGRRHALASDIAAQLGEPDSAPALLSKMLPWTDAECEEVEAYAALPFPRGIDMPAPLQRILLAEGNRTC